MDAADLAVPSPALTEHMLQEDTTMGGAGSARPTGPPSESSEDSEPELESGKHFAHCMCRVVVTSLRFFCKKQQKCDDRNFYVIEDLTEQELEAILNDDRARAVVNQLFQQSGNGEGQDEASSEDEDYEDEEDEDDDYEDDEECNSEEDDIRRRTFAFFGFGQPTVQKQLAKHPKLSECQPKQLVHPAAQMLNLSSAAVNGKDCLSAVHPLCDLHLHARSTSIQRVVLHLQHCPSPTCFILEYFLLYSRHF